MTVTINGNGAVTGFTALPDAAMSTGSIIQTVSSTTNSRLQHSGASWAASNLTADITPSVSSHKIYVSVTGDANTEASGRLMYLSIFRSTDSGSNWTNLGHADGGLTMVYGANSRIITPITMSLLDGPSTTNAVSYKVYMFVSGGSGTAEFPAGTQAPGVINLFEVVA